jgi:hypothetical protein
LFFSASYGGDCEDPYPSLSDFHDYEPNLEFDDSDLLQQKHPEHDDGNDFFEQNSNIKLFTCLDLMKLQLLYCKITIMVSNSMFG